MAAGVVAQEVTDRGDTEDLETLPVRLRDAENGNGRAGRGRDECPAWAGVAGQP